MIAAQKIVGSHALVTGGGSGVGRAVALDRHLRRPLDGRHRDRLFRAGLGDRHADARGRPDHGFAPDRGENHYVRPFD